MKKFFVLYMAKAEDFKDIMSRMSAMSEEERQASLNEWQAWSDTIGGIPDMGAPLGKTKKVTPNEISDMRNEIGGYTVIEAEDHEAAAKKLQGNPHFKMIPNGWVEVMEVMPM